MAYKGPEDVGTWFIINFYCQRIPMIPHDDYVATLQPAALLLQHPSNEIQVRNGKKNKGPFLLNEWMHSLVLTFIHSFMFSIHSFTAACGCGQGDYTNACNILIHSALLEDLMISSCSHVEVFPSHSSQIRKKDSRIVLEQDENPFTVTVILLLSLKILLYLWPHISHVTESRTLESPQVFVV